jgi:chemotaxis family two-component system response regulator Rcp1
MMEILLIEDNTGDIRLVKEGLKLSENHSNMTVIEDGNQAIAYLLNAGSSLKLPRPDLIILDLNLPGKDGHEILRFLKTDDRFKTIPVVVFSDSEAVTDIAEVYDMYANCFIIKPRDSSVFVKYIASIDNFWSNTVRIPTA